VQKRQDAVRNDNANFQIDYDSLPAIVITHDLRKNSFKWFKTCKEKLRTQMTDLTTISNRLGIYKDRDSSMFLVVY
jgi:hypothetical protein